MLQTRLMEKRRELVLQSDVDELTDQLCGVALTHLSGMAARCAPRNDLVTRRSIERVVFEVRTEMAKVCQEMADKTGEPPLDAASKSLLTHLSGFGRRRDTGQTPPPSAD